MNLFATAFGGSPLLNWALAFGLAALSLSLLLTLYRLLKGPSLPDRVMALDLLAFIAVGFIALYSVATGQEVYLDAAIALALIAFLGTLAFARFVERQAAQGETP